MNQFALEKRRGVLKGFCSRFRLASAGLALLAGLLAGCASAKTVTPPAVVGTFTPTPEKSPTAMFTATETPSPVSSLDTKVQELFKEQNVAYEVGADGSFQIDLYDSPQKETIELNGFTRVDTQDGLNPNILTAVDKENNNYAYNPDQGWFQIPEVYNPMTSIDWDRIKNKESSYVKEISNILQPENYPNAEEDFFNDGSFNITQALYYQNLPEEQKISPNAGKGQYWIGYDWPSQYSI